MPRGKHLLQAVLAHQHALFGRGELQRHDLLSQLLGLDLNALILHAKLIGQRLSLLKRLTAVRMISVKDSKKVKSASLSKKHLN